MDVAGAVLVDDTKQNEYDFIYFTTTRFCYLFYVCFFIFRWDCLLSHYSADRNPGMKFPNTSLCCILKYGIDILSLLSSIKQMNASSGVEWSLNIPPADYTAAEWNGSRAGEDGVIVLKICGSIDLVNGWCMAFREY